jgi:hypothetical protein
MMQHGPGLAASPPMRNNLEVGRRRILFLPFLGWTDNPIHNDVLTPLPPWCEQAYAIGTGKVGFSSNRGFSRLGPANRMG